MIDERHAIRPVEPAIGDAQVPVPEVLAPAEEKDGAVRRGEGRLGRLGSALPSLRLEGFQPWG